MLQAVFTDDSNIIAVSGLTQWNFGQEMEIHLADLPETFEAHFSYKGCQDAYVVEATASDGVSTVPIPNILLTQKNEAVCFVYYKDEDSGETVKTIRLLIKPRQKPSDYVYTETEVVSYTYLLRRIEELESNGVSTDVVAAAVAAWLEENPIDVPQNLSDLNDDSTHRTVTDEEKNTWNNKSNFSGVFNDLENKPTTLPNPNKLTIIYNGEKKEYDGSEALEITINTGEVERIEKLSTDSEVTLEPNKLYIFPEMETLTITLGEITDTSVVNEYHFIFQSGATATTLSIPDTIKVPDSFSVEASKVYEISILENCLCAQSWAVS